MTVQILSLCLRLHVCAICHHMCENSFCLEMPYLSYFWLSFIYCTPMCCCCLMVNHERLHSAQERWGIRCKKHKQDKVTKSTERKLRCRLQRSITEALTDLHTHSHVCLVGIRQKFVLHRSVLHLPCCQQALMFMCFMRLSSDFTGYWAVDAQSAKEGFLFSEKVSRCLNATAFLTLLQDKFPSCLLFVCACVSLEIHHWLTVVGDNG